MAGFHNPIGAFRRKAVYKNEKTDEQIADEVWLSSRAVRYRISKMMKKADMQGRSEIVALMREFDIWEK